MLHVIDGIFNDEEAAALGSAAAALTFEDGRGTAAGAAAEVKKNEQAVESPERAAVIERARNALAASPLVQSVARPRAFARVLVSRYRPGMHYGAHVDSAIVNGARTDLSFTLGLTPADAYEGGALVVEDAAQRRSVRVGAGQVVLYPSDTLHAVEPVSRGERLAVVGWITSWVRDPARRAILLDLDRTLHGLAGAGVDRSLTNRLLRTRTNLLRMWAEG
jgi:PKHD-type hydroxylase